MLINTLMIWSLIRVNDITKNPELQKQEDDEQMKAIQSNKNKEK